MTRTWYKLLLALVIVSMLLVTPVLAAPPMPGTQSNTPTTYVAGPVRPAAPAAAAQSPSLAPSQVVTVTILHTNDFHGNLDPVPSSSYPGMARTAAMIFSNTVAPSYTLILDAGDIMQGTLLSNLFHGESTIDVYNQVGYNVATFGNHEFDWGQDVLLSRTVQANFPFVSANIVVSDTGSCDTAGWTVPPFVDRPWVTVTLGTSPTVVIGIIGVTTQETPHITVDWATRGLCFKDPAASISHYWPELDAASDAIVVLSHLGLTDGGYGYGFPVYGDRTLARTLINSGTPVDLIIGGHTHTNMAAAEIIGNGVISTTVAQAHSAGRKVGKATLTIDKSTGDVGVAWQRLTVGMTVPQDPTILAAIAVWSSNPWYQGEINRVVGYTSVPITRNYNGDSLMGDFVDDALYNDLNNDGEPLNDVDMVFNNAGGIRVDFTFPPTVTWPQTITHGMMYNILPFGNATAVGDMTGAQILDLLDQSATLFKGAIQPAGMRFNFYCYTDTLPGPQPWAWGAYNVTVWNPNTSAWDPLDMGRTYRVATNEFLAPAGQDGYTPFKYMTNISYWGDMLIGVEHWVSTTYTISNPYNATLDGRIVRNGTPLGYGTIVPVTILHHNDQHGRLLKSGTNPGWTQLATLVAQERAHNPTRNVLLNAGDTIQGDSMSYYFKTAPFGYAADGTPIVTPTMHIQPAIAIMNAMTYTAMTLGNHEFNFGNHVFTGVLGMADFAVLGANVYDDGRYGLSQVPVQPDVEVSLPGPTGTIDIAILGIANHRVPSYELPSNIPGLSFTNPISETLARLPALEAANDAVVALTHIGFTTNPGSIEVDNNVDTYLAAQTSGIAAIIGGHSHTDPTKQTAASGDYKYLPAVLEGADGAPVLVTQMYRYNNYLGQVVLGFMPDGMGGYTLMTRAGRYIKVDAATVVEDPAILAIVQPYQNMLNAYNNRFLGYTTTPIDTMNAFTQETNGANMQADASVWELAQHGVNVDFHLSGAMTNQSIAPGATITDPYTLTVANMFTLMPYENSLLALQMNGPQLKTVLERGYRNYFYYKYVPGYGGYSYYTTCMLDTNAGNEIVYRDAYPYLPDGNNVAGLIIGGQPVDFLDATKYYTVSTVNYLAAGACNFSDGGVTLWPLSQIVADTQYYVRDAVINYTMHQGTVSPAIEGRLVFQHHFLYLPLLSK
jgi:2',3'-cyclic-nucleotide 2'-phosphodiesterase (5'-nucleotidase family)